MDTTPAEDAAAVASNAVGFDCETHLIARGRLAPRLVCLSMYGRGDPPPWIWASAGAMSGGALVLVAGPTWSAIFTGPTALDVFEGALRDPETCLVAHNAPFDLGVLAAYAGAHDDGHRTMLPLIFAALDQGRIRDTMIRETLLAVAYDRTGFDGGLPLAKTGRPAKARFDLAGLVLRYFGVDLAKDKVKSSAVACDVCDGVGRQTARSQSSQGVNEWSTWCVPCDGTGEVGPWRLRYHQLDGRPLSAWPDEAIDYAVADARWACLVHDAQSPPNELPAGVLVRGGEVTDEGPQLRAFFALHLMAVHGVRTDADAVEALAGEVEAVVAAGDLAAVEAGFVRDADGNAHADHTGKRGRPGSKSMAAIRGLVDAAYGEGHAPTTATGATKTDRDTLLASGDAALVAYADSGVARKILTTYVPLLRLGVHTPITSTPVPILKSGRAGWRNPSLQTGPRKGGYRACFVPRPGFAFVSADYHLAEICGLAQVHLWMGLGDTLAERLRRGEDVHIATGAAVMGVDYGEAFAAYHDALHPLHADAKRARQIAKAANFGFPGGLGAATFVAFARGYGIDLTEGEAADLRRDWMSAIPEMQAYFNYVGKATGFGPTTIRQYVSGRIRGGVGFCDGCNTLFQGIVADGAKAAAYDVSVACYTHDGRDGRPLSPLYGSRPWVFIHDEIIAEVPLVGLTAAADELSRLMVEAMKRYIPDVPIAASPAAMLRWHKGAEEVRGEDGALLVWSPA